MTSQPSHPPSHWIISPSRFASHLERLDCRRRGHGRSASARCWSVGRSVGGDASRRGSWRLGHLAVQPLNRIDRRGKRTKQQQGWCNTETAQRETDGNGRMKYKGSPSSAVEPRAKITGDISSSSGTGRVPPLRHPLKAAIGALKDAGAVRTMTHSGMNPGRSCSLRPCRLHVIAS